MLQVLQNLNSGETEIADVPTPAVQAGSVLIRSAASLVSAGTERILTQFARGNLLQKAMQQPERVRQVFQNVRTNGLLDTIDAVRARLDQPMPLGYSNAGVVERVGAGVDGFTVGERVVSNGHHAELVCVPKNLCARIPEGVSDEAAAFAVVGAIAMQGVRLIAPEIGERVAVIGLGLVGLLAVQILKANGCRVLGLDVDDARVALARGFGVEAVNVASGDAVAAAFRFSDGAGMDGVVIAASTQSAAPVADAAKMSRKRGRIVLVGVTGLTLDRRDFYEKELTFQVSCSYGPGRYDPAYEQEGHDYPLGYVRWTEQRNFEAVLELMRAGAIQTAPLVSHRFAIAEAQAAYDVLAGGAPSLGIVISYPPQATARSDGRTVRISAPAVARSTSKSEPVVALIGAGAYAARTLVPALRKAGAQTRTVVSLGGTNALVQARRAGAEQASTDADAVFADPLVNTVVIATRHDSHAALAVRALQAGKNVLAEKPLALSEDDVARVEAAYREAAAPRLMVGFNRRFAPLTQRMKQLLDTVGEPKTFIVTVNAGAVPADHWTADAAVGGGRIVGEACHFIDLLRHLAGHPIAAARSTFLADSATITLTFADGSHGTIHYFTNGSRAFPKERIEAFAAGRILQIDNFRRLTGYGWRGFSRMRTLRQDKGQNQCLAAFLDSIRKGTPAPIPAEELFEVSRWSIAAAHARS